jgi:glycosyltransferase involved in cell wall biosynthesis
MSCVSVVIPNYNYSRFLRETIDSVLAQTYREIEVIVVDDGSTDDSKEILAGYSDRIQTVFQQNQGVSAARNNGVKASRGKYVAFLDADDSWMPEKIEKQMARFAADDSLGLVHVGVREIDADGNVLLDRLEGLEGEVAKELLMLKREGVLGGGSGLMVPRVIFDEVGGFDTRLSTSADWDLFYQIASRHPVGFVPELLIRYRVHTSNMHSNVEVMEHDMSIAFEKAFGKEPPPSSRDAYGNLYKTLAGSYFRSGDYAAFIRSAVKSLGYQPGNLSYFIKFPLRRIKAQ